MKSSIQIEITYAPSDANSHAYIKETHGKKGEMIQGDFVSTVNGEKVVSITISVQE